MAQMNVAPQTTTPSTEFISSNHYQQSIPPEQLVMSIPRITTVEDSNFDGFNTQSNFPLVVDDLGFCEGMQSRKCFVQKKNDTRSATYTFVEGIPNPRFTLSINVQRGEFMIHFFRFSGLRLALMTNNQINFIKGQQMCESTIIFDVVNTSPSGSIPAIPTLEITRQPSSRPHRFRYRSEMHGTHGCEFKLNEFVPIDLKIDLFFSGAGLTAEDSTSKKKTYPTVVLKNLNSNAQVNIVCSLYQVNDHNGVKVQHSHKLVIKRENQDEDSDPHIKVPTKKSQNLHEAVFSDMGIIHTKRLVNQN